MWPKRYEAEAGDADKDRIYHPWQSISRADRNLRRRVNNCVGCGLLIGICEQRRRKGGPRNHAPLSPQHRHGMRRAYTTLHKVANRESLFTLDCAISRLGNGEPIARTTALHGPCERNGSERGKRCVRSTQAQRHARQDSERCCKGRSLGIHISLKGGWRAGLPGRRRTTSDGHSGQGNAAGSGSNPISSCGAGSA